MQTQSSISQILATCLKSIRRDKNITQKELADKLNVTNQQIGNYELCKSHMTIERFIEICYAIETDPVETLRNILQQQNSL